jgi:hypothetical protein
MVQGYNRLYAGAYAKPDYVSGVRAMISVLQDRYDLRRRVRSAPGQADAPEDPSESEQVGFEWDDGRNGAP